MLLGPSIDNGKIVLSFRPMDQPIPKSKFAIRVKYLSVPVETPVARWRYPSFFSPAYASTCAEEPQRVLNNILELTILPSSLSRIQVFNQDYLKGSNTHGVVDPSTGMDVTNYLASDELSSVFIVDFSSSNINDGANELNMSIELDSGEMFVTNPIYVELVD